MNLGALSLSARRAWIEITSQVPTWFGMPSLSARRAWIEINQIEADRRNLAKSLSARRAWIEINLSQTFARRWAVALRKESVDRN